MLHRRQWPLAVLLAAVLIFGVRLVRTLNASTIGWRPFVGQWIDAARSLAGAEAAPLGNQDPEDQAAFWLNETANIGAVDRDPQVAMGAAWMLDTPQPRWIVRHIRERNGYLDQSLPASWRRELDNDAIATLSEAFESRCRDTCLSLMETATRQDGSNVEHWRARALLLSQKQPLGLDLKPRKDDWLAILDDCAAHDPGNALYDYLAALQLWTSSADYDYDTTEDGYVRTVHDVETFAQGNERFTAGLKKTHLKFGDSHHRAAFAFLEQSNLPYEQQLYAAASREVDNRASALLYSLLRWQSVLLDVAKRDGGFDTATSAPRSILVIAEQIQEDGNPPNVSLLKLQLPRWSIANLRELSRNEPDLMRADEAEQLSEDLLDVRLDLRVLEQVGNRLRTQTGMTQATDDASGKPAAFHELLFAMLLAGSAQCVVLVSLGLAVALWLGARILGRRTADDPADVRIGWIGPVSAWLIGAAISFLVCGMLLPRFVAPTVWKDAPQLRIGADELWTALRLEESSWVWRLYQWQMYHGDVFAPVLAVSVLLAWQLYRQSRRMDGREHERFRSRMRTHVRVASDAVASSCLVAALTAFAVYLAVAPTVVARTDRFDRVHRERLTNPAETWLEITAVSNEIRSDDALMSKLRAAEEEFDRQLEEQRIEEQPAEE